MFNYFLRFAHIRAASTSASLRSPQRPLIRFTSFRSFPCVIHKRVASLPSTPAYSLHFVLLISVRRGINTNKVDYKQACIDLVYIYSACAKRLVSCHLFCYFCCEVFFFLLKTFTSFITYILLDADVCTCCLSNTCNILCN